MTTSTFAVAGPADQYDVDAVTAEVGRLPGVDQVTVDPAGATMTVDHRGPLPVAAVRAALRDAGFDLTDEG